MTTTDRIASALLRIYPKSWRQEYGAEFEELLRSRPLTAWIIADVVRSGLGERARVTTLATRIGLVGMVATGGWMIWSGSPAVLLRESNKLLPRVIVLPLASDPYLLFLALLGGVIVARGGTPSAAGRAAATMSFFTGLPVAIVGFLMLARLVPAVILAAAYAPSALSVLTAPLFRLPEAWLLGSLGGYLTAKLLRHNGPERGVA
jgi:hypothetical protein